MPEGCSNKPGVKLSPRASKAGTTVVLLYHRIGAPKWSSLVRGQYVIPAFFSGGIDYLLGHGWRVISLAETAQRCGSGLDGTGNTFSITFDDGYRSVYELAYPALVKRNLTATVFVVADALGGSNMWDRDMGDLPEEIMSLEQLREMSKNGFEIGSHTLTHAHLPHVPSEQLVRELVDSKHKLEDILGREISSLCYPYGEHDDRVVQAAADAGYRCAVTTKLGTVGKDTDVLRIPRLNMRWNAFGLHLMRKIRRARAVSRASR
jgi:peptidoglycan/xylan/chitin deacetylase (PgdA/CDA1 family)